MRSLPLRAAVLESGAFGPWAPPDYRALAAATPAEYAAMRAAGGGSSGAAASPAAAALPLPPGQDGQDGSALGIGARTLGAQEDGAPPGTPDKAAFAAEEQAAAVAAALASPPPTPAQVAVEKRAADWVERVLLPAVNRQVSRASHATTEYAISPSAVACIGLQGPNGWNLLAALQDVRQHVLKEEDEESRRAVEAVEQRVKDVSA